jgi:DNA primase
MGIVDEDIVKARESADIVAIISNHVQLRRVGRRWVGLCPFHPERSPSFSVNQEMGLYYCFGCGAKGDAISFLRNAEHLDFVGAVEKLAGMTGVQLRYSDVADKEFWKKKNDLMEALEKAANFYHEQLLSSSEAGTARSYLRSRGFTADEVKKYRLGWAPEHGNAILNDLQISAPIAEEASLVQTNEKGTTRDFFRGRIMFPIFSATDNVIGFGGRILPETEGAKGPKGPKYKNSSSNPVYDKSKVFYGLNWAKSSIVQTDRIIICEGYVDVIGFAASGLESAVATCGTALTEEHVKAITHYTHNVVLAFDADNAGQAAAERLYAWEKKYGLNITVVSMPEGTDPGELGRSNPEGLHVAVDAAVPFMRFRMERVLKDFDLSTIENRVRAAEKALQVISEHPDPLIRDQYIVELGDKLSLTPDELRKRTSNIKPAQRPLRQTETSSNETTEERINAESLGLTEDSAELEALRIMLDTPTSRKLFHPVLFRNQTCLTTYTSLVDTNWDMAALEEKTPQTIVSFVQRLAVQEPKADPVEVLQRMVEVAAHEKIKQLVNESKTATTEEELLSISETTRWLKSEIELLRSSITAADAVPNIFEWLIESFEIETVNNQTN